MLVRSIAFTLTMLLPAAAQTIAISRTVNLINKATQEVLGTATTSGNRVYFRDRDGKHIVTVERNADGTRTAYDESGKVIPMPEIAK